MSTSRLPSTRVTLHEELTDILRSRGNAWMTTSELANAVNYHGRYRKKDASSVTAFQVHGRARQYGELFERDGSRIRLAVETVAVQDMAERRYLMQTWSRDQWKFEQREGRQGESLDHSASGSKEFGKLHEGDRLYVVGLSEAGRLLLIGRTDVVERVPQQQAEAELGYAVFKAKHHVLGANGTPRRFDVDVPENIARAIKSDGGKPIKFASDIEYRFARNALRPRRWLSEESARLLDDVIATADDWSTTAIESDHARRDTGMQLRAVQASNVDGYESRSTKATRLAIRRESRLVGEYYAYMKDIGDDFGSHEIPLEDGMRRIYSDIFNVTRNQLIEAKASTKRNDVRMAIGQLADYGRHYQTAQRAVLLPKKPDDDLLALLASQGIAAIWKNGSGFDDTADGYFTVPVARLLRRAGVWPVDTAVNPVHH